MPTATWTSTAQPGRPTSCHARRFHGCHDGGDGDGDRVQRHLCRNCWCRSWGDHRLMLPEEEASPPLTGVCAIPVLLLRFIVGFLVVAVRSITHTSSQATEPVSVRVVLGESQSAKVVGMLIISTTGRSQLPSRCCIPSLSCPRKKKWDGPVFGRGNCSAVCSAV